MEDPKFPSNSKSDKEPAKEIEKVSGDKPKLERVVSGQVKVKKRGLASKFRESFSGDDAKSVGDYLVFDVFVPAAKDFLADAAAKGVERLLFGDVRGRVRSGNTSSRPGYTNYNTVSTSRAATGRAGEPDNREMSRSARASHNFGEIVLGDKGEAEFVIEQLFLILQQYERVRVSDLYELVGITGHPIDDRWGWVELPGAHSERARDGYLLVLPRPVQLD